MSCRLLHAVPALRGGKRCGRPGPPVSKGPTLYTTVLHVHIQMQVNRKKTERSKESQREVRRRRRRAAKSQ
jgi:hypothetical protein